jgi:hypothetical protein
MGYRPDAIEAQLAHAEPNSVRRTYNHATYLDERRVMMQAWANKLDKWKLANAQAIVCRKANGAQQQGSQ